MAIDQRLLKIKRDFLKEKHGEAEAIINQERFTKKDVEKLIYHYEFAAEYAELFYDFVTHDAASLKKDLKQIMQNKSATFNIGSVLDRVKEKLKEQGKTEELKKLNKLIGKKKP